METDHRFVQQEFLVNEAYRDSSKLDARRQIYRFLRSKQSFPQWMLGYLEGHLGRVLHVGCGPGFYMEKVQPRADLTVGIDLSPGMVREAKRNSRVVAVADAERLPFASERFDTTLCIHVLYHVANIARAVGELRRVTRKGGRVVVVTNGTDHMRQLREDFDLQVQEVGSVSSSVLSEPRRFRMEEGEAVLAQFFDHVERYDLRSDLEVPEGEAVARYLESIRSFHEPKLPREVSWEVVVGKLMDRVGAIIQGQSVYRITTHSGMFVCHDAG